MVNQGADERVLELSVPYLVLLNYIAGLPRLELPAFSQFVLAAVRSEADPGVAQVDRRCEGFEAGPRAMLLLAAVVSIHWDFEGGSLGRVETAGPAHFRAHLAGQTDQDGRNRQANWYYFRVDGAKGVEVTID